MLLSIPLLFGVDVVLRNLLGGSPNLWLGLVFAFVVYALLFIGVSRLIRHPFGIWPAALAAFLFIVVLPVVVTWKGHSDGPPIRSQARIPGRIDLVIVSPSARHERVPRPSVPPADLAAWDLRYTVAVPAPDGKGLEILVAGTDSRSLALRALRTGQALEPGGSQVQWRPGAQRAVVLDVDEAPVSVPGPGSGGSSASEPADNSPLVAAAASLRAPDYALLADAGGQLLVDWNGWAQEHRGEADALADLEGPTLLDASLRLVAQSRSTLADRRLAYAYRPMLFFDKRELYAWPVDVDAAFEEGDVEMCKHSLPGDKCEEVKRAAGLDQSFDYLHFDIQRFTQRERTHSPQAVGSTYYYHVVHGKSGGDTEIDYWWYLPYNPSLSSWMCSPGFSVTDFDCFDHESDWEGITVGVGAEGKPPPFVYYAQHSNVARFSWGELEKSWAKLPQDRLVDAHGAHHPLVFVARASHASYRVPCSDSVCFEQSSVLPEGKHNGEGEWSGDDDEVCAGLCLKPLPVNRVDRPATWNAFSGPWGTQTCILWGTFCDRGEAPHSPSFQPRYREPGVVR
ncbi:MAG TPA: hypothetical protein VGN84_13480 [Solirubrobacterales bacterium]|nr:hypothetical protein [Solirubrobacterales bacterium]